MDIRVGSRSPLPVIGTAQLLMISDIDTTGGWIAGVERVLSDNGDG